MGSVVPKQTPEKYSLEFTLKGLPKTPNQNRHWTKRYRENLRWRSGVASAVQARLPARPLKKARLTLTRISSVQGDYDNRVASFKPVLDALVYSGVLQDDCEECIGQPEYLWLPAEKNNGEITIRIEEVK